METLEEEYSKAQNRAQLYLDRRLNDSSRNLELGFLEGDHFIMVAEEAANGRHLGNEDLDAYIRDQHRCHLGSKEVDVNIKHQHGRQLENKEAYAAIIG